MGTKPTLRLLAACVLTFIAVAVRAQSFRAGAAVRNITPDPLLPVSGGIGQPVPATRKQGELTVRALVLERGATRIAIVGIDNLGWTSLLGDRSRALIRSVPPANVLIGATHTHSAPDAYGFPDASGRHHADLAYLDRCTRMVAEAVEEAAARLQPATLRTAVGEARGRIAYNYYAPDLYDPRCGVIQAVAREGAGKGATIATLVNYAVHPEVIGSKRGILSPDLCGPLYERIEERGGGIAIFMNGAQGGMVTADNRREGGKEANDWQECIRIGRLLADEALRIVSEAPAQEDPVLHCASRRIELPVASPLMRQIMRYAAIPYPKGGSDSVSTVLNLLNIGTAQVLTIPGEALPNIGYYLKRKMRTAQPFLFGLTNDAFGYILTKEDFDSFRRYEYVTRTSLGEMTGEVYMREALRLVADSPPAAR